jgi:hypothetical protein
VTLILGMDASPNTEAETAMDLIDRLSRTKIGRRILCVIYDKALRGVHLERILTLYGYIPVVKVALAPTDEEERAEREAASAGPKFKELVVGPVDHTTRSGRKCHHLLHSVNGKVIEVDHYGEGKLAPVGAPYRRQVKRYERTDPERPFHFTVGYLVECPNGPFVTWVVPHGRRGEEGTRRAENIRVFPDDPEDEVFAALYPRRNDTEGLHSRYKKTLPNKRALSLGGNRILVEMALFAIIENADTWYRKVGHQAVAEAKAA